MVRVGALKKQDTLDFRKGFNTYSANDVVPPDQLVYATDARISTLGRYKTKQGCDFYSVPAGETLDTQQTSTTGAADQTIGLTSWRAAKFTTGAAGRLTKVELRLKSVTSGTGPVMVEIRSDSSGSPGSLLAQSSIPAASLTSSYQYLGARFIEAPALANATAYWIVAYIQEDGTNTYNWSSTTNATTSKSSSNSGVSWSTTTFDLNFKTYLSTDSPSLGYYRAYKSDGTKRSLIAHGTTLYSIDDATGALTSIKTGLSAATDYDFETMNDTVYYVNGVDAPRKWDFTTESAVTALAGVACSHVIQHKSMLFFVSASDPTKIFFSNPADPETYTSTDFLYVPAPKSPNKIINWCILNDNLVIFTPVNKWALYGSDLASMVLRETPGTKGLVARRSLVVARNHAYFASDDGAYRFNGSTDELLTRDFTSDYAAIVNRTAMAGAVWNNRYYLAYTPPGQAANSQTLVYNLNYDSLESIDLATYVKMMAVWKGSVDSNQFVHVSNLVGSVRYAEQSSNSYNNLGKPLSFELRTRYEYYSDPSAKKKIRRWFPRFKSSAGPYSVSVQYDLDFADQPTTNTVALQGSGSTWGGGGTWGSGLTWGTSQIVTPKLNVPGSARYTQRRYKRSGVNTPVEVLGDSVYFRTKRAH